MKVLITGGCGFIGTNLSIFLKKKGYNISTLDNLSRKGSVFNYQILKKLKIKNYRFDISNGKKLNILPKFDLIIDCCAEAAVEISRKDVDRVFNTNLLGTLNVMKKVKKDKSKIIFLSSSRVYSIGALNNLIANKVLKKKIKTSIEIKENFKCDEPEASVIHFHGVGHHGNLKRVSTISKILKRKISKNKKRSIICIIPLNKPIKINGKYLVEKTIDDLKKVKEIDKIFISTADKKLDNTVRKIMSITSGRNIQEQDKYLRETISVTANARNIGLN